MNEIRRRARWVVPQIFGLCLVAYFTYHLIQGDRGIRTYIKLTEELAEAEANSALLTAELDRERLKVAGLSNGSLDPDLLEERANNLNLYHSDEVIVFLPAEQQ